MGDNGAKVPCDSATGSREGVEQSAGGRTSESAVITEPTSTTADTSRFPAGAASGPLPVAGLASVPNPGITTVTGTPPLSSPHSSSACIELSNTNTNSFGSVPDGESRQ